MKRLFFVLSIAFLFCSCKKGNNSIIFDLKDPLSITPDLSWAVVDSAYAAFRKDCTFDSEVTAHGRKDDILLVLGKQTVSVPSENSGNSSVLVVWYKFEQGWLDESLLRIYDTKLKAQSSITK